MSEPFLAEIRIVGFNFAPKGWATCDGQVLPISQNTALFSLLGTTYGGNGTTTFALPNLQGRAPMHHGLGAGLTRRELGETGGSTTVQLLPNHLPAHQHTVRTTTTAALAADPTGNLPALAPEDTYQDPSGKSPVIMQQDNVGLSGGDQPHNNLQPSLAILFVIALQGLFPSRS